MTNDHPSRFYDFCDTVSFRKTTEKWGGLSNMARDYDLNINGIPIQSSEILYQACRFPLYPEIQREILLQDNPMVAKRVAQKYLDKTRDKWDSQRILIMKWVVFVKLCQNWDKFYFLLDKTGMKNIVEHSEKDLFWGARKENKCFYGVNALGRILMFVRQKAREFGQNFFINIPPLRIKNFTLLNNNIKTVTSYEKKDNYNLFD